MYLNLVCGLLCFEVLAELLLDIRQIFVGHLGIRVLIDFDTEFFKEGNKVAEADVELPHQFVNSDFCHSLTVMINLQIPI